MQSPTPALQTSGLLWIEKQEERLARRTVLLACQHLASEFAQYAQQLAMCEEFAVPSDTHCPHLCLFGCSHASAKGCLVQMSPACLGWLGLSPQPSHEGQMPRLLSARLGWAYDAVTWHFQHFRHLFLRLEEHPKIWQPVAQCGDAPVAVVPHP